jgi:hypothetical protein
MLLALGLLMVNSHELKKHISEIKEHSSEIL